MATETPLSLILFTASSLLLAWSSRRRSQSKRQGSSADDGTTPSSDSSLTKAEVLDLRQRHVSPSVSVSYSNTGGLMMMQGRGSKLYDEEGTEYLDTRNNVCHVGHCHPKVAGAVSKQVHQLNTNTRYLHPNMAKLAKKLVSKCPDPLEVVVLVNSGSEANDLALRLARAHADGSRNVICFDGAYHGHTMSVLEISPYKYEMGTEYTGGLSRLGLQKQPTTSAFSSSSKKELDGSDNSQEEKKSGGLDVDQYDSSPPCFATPAPYIWQCVRPDVYRGPHRGPNAGFEYARYVEEACHHITTVRREPVAAMIMEGGLSIGGCLLPPPGFLQRSVKAVRAAGGLWIADEVQTGLGRCGSTYWAWQQGINHDDPVEKELCPDIMVVGKPLGNGMPCAAVITTREVANCFHTLGVDYFNTFGGNPVCAAAGLAVLETIEEDGLQANALEVGTYLRDRFREVQAKQVPASNDAMTTVLIGDVRGSGLFVGIELVTNCTTLEPATKEISYLSTLLKQKYKVLTTIDGQFENVLIVKPPLVFSKKDVDRFVECFAMTVEDLKQVPKAQILGMSKTPT